MEAVLPLDLTGFTMPAVHQKRMRSSTALERVNPETKCSTRVDRQFPSQASWLRLVGNQLIRFWPAEAVGFILEATETLTDLSWTPVIGVVNNQVTVDAVDGRRYLRLKK